MQTRKWMVLAGGSLIFTLAFAPLARADFEADVQIKSGGKVMGGKAHYKQPKMRMDLTQGGMPMSMIVNWKERSALMLMHPQKMLMKSDLSKVKTEMPNCDSGDIDACFLAQGFKKTGTETVNGHPSAVYEKDNAIPSGKRSHSKIWRPTDLKEVPITRSLVTGVGPEDTAQTDFTNIKMTAQADSLFMAPSGYREMDLGAMGGGMPSGAGRPGMPQGMTQEKIRAMMQKMQQQKQQDGDQ